MKLFYCLIKTPIGDMVAIADSEVVLYLGFSDQNMIVDEMDRLARECLLSKDQVAPLLMIKEELLEYFRGNIREFRTPRRLNASSFMEDVLNKVEKIPFGKTVSYSELNRTSSCRAVAKAVSRNPLLLVVPCHRVIYKNGAIGGYSGGVSRKKWLLQHEKSCFL